MAVRRGGLGLRRQIRSCAASRCVSLSTAAAAAALLCFRPARRGGDRCFAMAAATGLEHAACSTRQPGDSATSPPSAFAFLQEGHKHITSKGPAGTTFVIGNEAGDLDSIVSALAVAYGLSQLSGGTTNADRTVAAVAVCRFPRAEFRLRQDAQRVFEDAGFAMDSQGAPTSLLFWDEVDWDSVGASHTTLVLTDHNQASTFLANVFGQVSLIIDHHADAGQHQEAERMIDASAGSCCTLVAEWLAERGVVLPLDLGGLLLGVVLLDTRNFDTEAKRFSARDERAVDNLRQFLPPSVASKAGQSQNEALSRWYQTIHSARYDVSQLCISDLLKLDYKEDVIDGCGSDSCRIGFCAVFDSLSGAAKRAGSVDALADELRGFAARRMVDILLVMTREEEQPDSGEKAKGLIVYDSKGESLDIEVIEFLKGCPEGLSETLVAEELFLTQAVVSEGFGLRPRRDLEPLLAFSFRSLVTRKTIRPAVLNFLKRKFEPGQ